MDQNQSTTAEELAKNIIAGLRDKKAGRIVQIDLLGIPNAICRYFIVCQGNSRTQVQAIADAAIEKVRIENHEKPWQKEGYENSEWILIDYVDVVLHVFQPRVRDFYKVEELWADAKITEFQDE